MIGTSALAIASAFNLVCSVTHISVDAKGATETSKRSFELRIDTEAMRWCADECQRSNHIVQVLERWFILSEYPDGMFLGTARGKNGSVFELQTVNRENGQYTFDRGIIGGAVEAELGKCEVAPFTGLPTIKF